MNAPMRERQHSESTRGVGSTLTAIREAIRVRAVRPTFVAREVWAALRRHTGTAIAVIVTATLALVMLGGALLLRAQIDDLKGAWYDKTQVTAYIANDATEAQIADLRTELDGNELVQRVWFEDRDLAYKNFSEQFSSSPELVAEVTADQLPESFRIKLVDSSQGSELVEGLTGMAGVRQVVDEHAQLATLFDVLTGFQTAAVLLAIIQALAAVVLISNMVRSTITLRARELEVGRVMGASRSQLGLPFLAEVGTYGVVGTALAVGLLAIAKGELIDKRLAESGILSGVIGYVGWDALWASIPWLLLAGAGLPMLVTAIALNKHLRT